MTRLLRTDPDAVLRDVIHEKFLAWVNAKVPDNGSKPGDFAQKVTRGWPAAKGSARNFTFYDVFAVFFREELKAGDRTFRSFCLAVTTEIQQNLKQIQSSLPDKASWDRFSAVLASFDSHGIEASFVDLGERQNS
jgi:hypothetical protein